jgi:ubiquinol-cytochrome c reductase cytochrome c subunit
MKMICQSRPAALVLFAVVLFLGTASTQMAKPAQEGKSSATPAGNAENGKQLFMKNGCYQCHGREGQGSVVTGPRIAPDPLPFEVISAYIRKPTGEMPPYTEKVLSDKDLADIYAYLRSRAHPPTAKAAPLLK